MKTLKGLVLLFPFLLHCFRITEQVPVAANTLSFEVTRVDVNESDGAVQACVRYTGRSRVSNFRLYTTAADAHASSDFVPFDNIVWIWSDRQCYHLDILNDNISEPVESFQVSLDAAITGQDVVFINQTLTVYVSDDDAPTCTINLIDEIMAEREHVAINMRNLLPLNISGSNESGEENIDNIYRDLARALNQNTSDIGHDRFVAAIDEIFASYREECGSRGSLPERVELSNLAVTFREAMRGLSQPGNLARARSIYGRFLCYSNHAVPPTTGPVSRTKRQLEQGLPTTCPDYNCNEVVTEPCHFFRCLHTLEIEYITGFGNVFSPDPSNLIEPCIGFVVDTTGSMGSEIEAARNVILQFMEAQADSTVCYMLVPFNDYVDYHRLYTEIPPDVGPVLHAYTSGMNNTMVLEQLRRFEAAVNNLRAVHGGDFPEYALDAMLAALDYSITDDLGNSFQLMHYHSRMVVITDATSKNPDLEATVINRARQQGVAIHFILSDDSRLHNYTTYDNIARQTGGHIYLNHHSRWSVINFQLGIPTSGPSGRKRRSSLVFPVFERSFNVSLFTTSLAVSTYSIGEDDILGVYTSGLRMTSERGMTSLASLTAIDHVGLYVTRAPTAGNYTVTTTTELEEVVIRQDISMDISIVYMDTAATNFSIHPPPACTHSKLTLATSRIGEISSLSLNETGAGGTSRLIPLTKCSNAFTCDYNFRPGTFYFQVQGVDSNGVDFAYNFNKSVSIRTDAAQFTLRPMHTAPLIVNTSAIFQVEFELRNNDSIGEISFTLQVAAPAFAPTLDASTVRLSPKQTRTITVSGRVGPIISSRTSHSLTLTATNDCITLSASRSVTDLAPAPRSSPATNMCGCQNGGTCNVIVLRRGRTVRSCSCAPGYRGPRCATRI